MRSISSGSSTAVASGRGSSAVKRVAISSNASAKTGWAARSPPAMPTRWLPWPLSRNASLPCARARPRTTAGSGSPAASERRPASSVWSSAPTTTARWLSRARVVASADARSWSGWAWAYASIRPPWARRAAVSRADSSSARTGRCTAGAGAVGAVGAGSASGTGRVGACSRMTCALVPLIPNADTAPRRGRPVSGQSRAWVISSTLPAVQSTWGVGASTCSVAGSRARPSASTILITPARPAAAWVCPMFDLIEPSSSGSSRSCP